MRNSHGLCVAALAGPIPRCLASLRERDALAVEVKRDRAALIAAQDTNVAREIALDHLGLGMTVAIAVTQLEQRQLRLDRIKEFSS